MQSKYITMGGGAATVLSMFLPFISVLGVSQTGMAMGGVAYFFIICGLLGIWAGLSGKRLMNVLSL